MRHANTTFVIGFLMILALTAMASAALSDNAPSSISPEDSSVTFTISANNGTSTTGLEVVSINNGNITINGASVTISGISGFDSVTWKVNATDGNETGSTISKEYTFCSAGEKGSNFKIDDFDVNEDDEWSYFDNIEIEVKVENTDDDDNVRDVMVEVVVFDEDGNDVTSDFDFDDEAIDLGKINDDDSEVAKFTIDSLSPKDLEEGKYRAYFKAYSDDEGESAKCTQDVDWEGDDYFDFEINNDDLDDDFLVDDNDEITASCGDEDVIVEFEIWNLPRGNDEDKVLVNLYSSSLGVDEYVVVDDLDAGDNEDVSFLFDMPDYVSKNTYDLDVIVRYDYDEDESEFDRDAYDEKSEDNFQIRLNVLNCKAPQPTLSVSTNDEIKVGSEFTFEVNVKNNAADKQNVIVSLSDVSSWAEDVSVEPAVVTLDGGETKPVTVTLVPTEKGAHSFAIKSTIGTETYSQPISVDVDARWSLGKYFSKDYWEYWVAIGLIVLILIVLIAIIAVMRR